MNTKNIIVTLTLALTLSTTIAQGATLANMFGVTATPVAEPAIMVLIGAGLLGLASLINRKTKK